MSFYRAGLASLGGSILLPEAQEKRLEQMRRDSLDRIDHAAATIKGGMLGSAAVTAISTAALLLAARNMTKGGSRG